MLQILDDDKTIVSVEQKIYIVTYSFYVVTLCYHDNFNPKRTRNSTYLTQRLH